MTISSENVLNTYSGNDSTTVFAYSYKIIDEDHLAVVIADSDDDQTTLTISTYYTVSGVGNEGGGNVTLLDLTAICGQATLPTGWTLAITRDVPLLQETDFNNQGGFYADNHEDAFDYLTMITHQLQEQLDRCPKVTQTSGDTGDDYITNIETYVAAASASASAASASETAAAASETAAAASETAAAASETAAAASETAAAASESAASTSETNAASSASAASTSASAAATSASNASTSASNAATSETNAAASESAAATSETNAAASETAAAASESAAATSETNAAASETAAAASAALFPTISGGDALSLMKVNSGETGHEYTDVKVTADDILSLPEQSSSPSTPSAGRRLVYPKDDGRLYQMNDDGDEIEIGAGAGNVDFLSLKTISDFNSYDEGAVAAPVDGTGGSPTAVSVTEETSTPINTDATELNIKISKTAADGQGEGISVDFTTRGQVDYARSQQVILEVITTANYADDDFGIYLYDKDNSQLIYPIKIDLKASTLVSRQIFSFQTSADADDYRLIFHCQSTNASAYDITCTVKVGPSFQNIGIPITEWIDYTPTFNTSFTVGTGGSAYQGFGYRRVGDTMEIRGSFTLGSSGASMGTGDLTISLPSGLSVDDTKLLGQGNLWAVVGYAYINDVDTTNRYDFTVFREAGYDHLKIISQNGATVDSVDASVPMTWAAGDTFNLVVSGIPIVGWDSNSVMSEIDDGRSVCALTSKASPTLISGTIAAGSAVFAFDVIKDTHNSYDNTTGVYTCPVTGFYEVEYGARVTGSGTGGYITPKIIQAGGLANTYTKPTFFTGESQANGHGIVMKSHFYCEKGNTLSPRLESNFTSAALTSDVTANFFHVKKLNNSSLIANTELVACKYSTNAGQSISSGSYEIVDFEDKSYDTHNAVTVGASWKFTAPYSGKYHISAKTIFDTITLDSGEVVWSGIYKNGAANSYKVAHQAIGTGAVAVSADINIDIDLVEGDYVDYRAYQSSGGAVALYSANTYNQISIHRVS